MRIKILVSREGSEAPYVDKIVDNVDLTKHYTITKDGQGRFELVIKFSYSTQSEDDPPESCALTN